MPNDAARQPGGLAERRSAGGWRFFLAVRRALIDNMRWAENRQLRGSQRQPPAERVGGASSESVVRDLGNLVGGNLSLIGKLF